MIWLLVAALLALTCYASTLTNALRQYTRAGLAEHVPADQQRGWLDWLDHTWLELPALTGLVRLLANMGVYVCLLAWVLEDRVQPVLRDWAIATGLAFGFLSFFAIAIPQVVALQSGDQILASNLRPLYVLHVAFWPVRLVMQSLDWMLRKVLGRKDDPEGDADRAEQEILAAVNEGEIAGHVAEGQREMIRSVIELNQTAVSAIMTPRTQVVAVPIEATLAEVTDAFRTHQHSRIPVYEGSLDRILGVLYAKDLIGLDVTAPFDLRVILRTVPYVPPVKPIDELLAEFRHGKVHIAIVLDEYGGTAGLVTIEDILEEVVGEIEDEYDEEPAPGVHRVDGQTIEADARVHVAEINHALGIEIPENGVYETIGGFVLTRLGRIPATGEELRHENVLIRVLEAEPRKITRVRLELQPAEEAVGAAKGA